MKNMKKWLMFLGVMMTCAAVQAKEPVSVATLLAEMTDRAAVARFPDPAYTCKQASSYDRAAKSPEQDWFANGDASQFVRVEENAGRKEWVLMDAEGPGAIVRWWITAPHYRTTIRIYIDGSDTPAVEANAGDLLGGEALVGAPLSAQRARGRNLYLPIPYTKSIKVTADKMWTGNRDEEQGNLYYQINYRTYAAGTEVVSFSKEELKAAEELVARQQKELLEVSDATRRSVRFEEGNAIEIAPGEKWEAKDEDKGAITLLAVKVIGDEDITQALRSTLLRITFDDADTPHVLCPLGEFFGSGVGANAFRSWYTTVTEDGSMCSLWVMPFQKSWKVSLENEGKEAITAAIIVRTEDFKWDDRSMYFHCNWRQQREVPTRPMIDWEYIKLQGEGVFVGDVLTVLNRVPDWWGEGDEKIYVDGEAFPSHFGTGTEDYYGYAWCTPHFFEAPFHAQPRAEGPGNYGNTTNLRYRALDAIPFTKDFRFDMEVWHWHATTTIDYAAAVMWYGKPGTKAVGAPSCEEVIAEAKMPVSYVSPKFLPRIPGFTFKSAPAGSVEVQNMSQFTGGKWHEDRQLWWKGAKPGDKLELTVTLEKSGKQRFVCSMTKAVDYGTVQFYLDGEKIGQPVDLFNNGVIHTGDLTLGEVDAEAGEHTLTVEITGKNEKATNYLFGMDQFRFE